MLGGVQVVAHSPPSKAERNNEENTSYDAFNKHSVATLERTQSA